MHAARIKEDEFGPECLVRVYDPTLGMRGFLVIDNTTLGPGKGGIRMTPSVTEEEIFRLARTMTWKNALAGIPFGGAKAGIVWHGGPDSLKKKYIQSFARVIMSFTPRRYIAGPDVGTTEREMRWFMEASRDKQSATGKPASLGGLPHELGSTGFGVAHAARVAAETLGLKIHGATVAIHGFGNVGTFAAKFLSDMGAVVVGLADRSGSFFSPSGFDKRTFEKAMYGKKKNLTAHFPRAKIPANHFWGLPADILIPASVTDVIHAGNRESIRARLIVEGGNIPMNESTEKELFRKGVWIVPDIVANAGGVISSYAEHQGYGSARMFRMVEEKVTSVVGRVMRESIRLKKNPREVAMKLAVGRVKARMQF